VLARTKCVPTTGWPASGSSRSTGEDAEPHRGVGHARLLAEDRLGQIHLARNALHRHAGDVVACREDRKRIPAERPVGENVDPMIAQGDHGARTGLRRGFRSSTGKYTIADELRDDFVTPRRKVPAAFAEGEHRFDAVLAEERGQIEHGQPRRTEDLRGLSHHGVVLAGESLTLVRDDHEREPNAFGLGDGRCLRDDLREVGVIDARVRLPGQPEMISQGCESQKTLPVERCRQRLRLRLAQELVGIRRVEVVHGFFDLVSTPEQPLRSACFHVATEQAVWLLRGHLGQIITGIVKPDHVPHAHGLDVLDQGGEVELRTVASHAQVQEGGDRLPQEVREASTIRLAEALHERVADQGEVEVRPVPDAVRIVEPVTVGPRDHVRPASLQTTMVRCGVLPSGITFTARLMSRKKGCAGTPSLRRSARPRRSSADPSRSRLGLRPARCAPGGSIPRAASMPPPHSPR